MIEEKLLTKIIDNYDVVVCGGGFAGISAALASTRQGKRTLLIEKQFMLGGLATAGIVTIYLPLCDGKGKQVSFGIAEELLKLSIKYGAEDRYPENWLDGEGTRTEKDKRFEVRYNPQVFAILAEQLLVNEGVDILYGTYVTSVYKNNDKIDCIIVENKSGRVGYGVKSVVDATGDCDVAKLGDVPTITFKQGNVLAAWYYSCGLKGYNLNMVGFADVPDEDKTEENKIEVLNNRRFLGLDGKELSEMMIMSHTSTMNHFLSKREDDETYWPVTMATIPQIRMTRKIVGEYMLSHDEVHKEFNDSVGMVSNWKRRGPIYEVPFRTLYSKTVKNLIVAGRCTSVNEIMWDIMRVIPCCAVTGQAAGIAAAMTDDFSSLDVEMLQEELRKNGVILHEKELE
ncbi:MAG: FAD-dependent oxidoreductase [Eubacteriales bacterium]|nr:FAD-dependent oxidoreductase [Eubacteriales bacterium]